MAKYELIRGFSKLGRREKIGFLSELLMNPEVKSFFDSFVMSDSEIQSRFESFSENTISNYHLPYGIIPNVVIDGKVYHVPAVIEESSVVAAASKAASFWAQRGGFKCTELSTSKLGHVHFRFDKGYELLKEAWPALQNEMRSSLKGMSLRMEERGGGIEALDLKHLPEIADDFFQIEIKAQTVDSMGANFINTLLEEIGKHLSDLMKKHIGDCNVDVLMCILSNYTPDCIVGIKIESHVSELGWQAGVSGRDFARRMELAWRVAHQDTYRAVTHNKGIFNGIDAVVLATGNDFRAVEAAGHAYAARDGKYRSLSTITLRQDYFAMELKLPMALGTVGGLTSLHPLAEKSLEILGKPDAKELMKISASVGLANNFAAMASLVTTGIQKGHMKMHLQNILNALNVTDPAVRKQLTAYFHEKTVSVSAVKNFIDQMNAK